MESGTEQPANSSYISHFEISNNFAWRGSRPQEIEQRRALLDDLLIFDILLRSGGIRSPDIIYPPHDEHTLARLLDAIETCNYDSLKKDCLVYFLLKWHQDGREELFAAQKCIPPQFVALTDAYWHLDSGINLSYGVSIFADARLNRDYASKILQALSLRPDASALIRKYVRTANPPLTEPNDIELFTLALADSSLLEAWQFQRTFHETNEIRPRLLRKMLEWCVSPKPKPAPLMQLLGLPLSDFEESILHSSVLKPPSTLPFDAVPLLQDLICVRLIQVGRYIEAIRMDREFSASKIGSHIRQAQERSQMVQDLYDSLPATERAYIDAELVISSPSGGPSKSGQRYSPAKDVDMAQSWEEIHLSDMPASTSKSQASRPISERANAPRFGGPAPSPSALPSFPPAPVLVPSRQSFPAPSPSLPKPSSSRARASLSNTAGRLVLGTLPHVSSPLSGTKFPVLSSSQPQKQAGSHFISASRQPNAFYKPPPAKANGHAQPLFPPRIQSQANGSVQKSSHKEANDVEMKDGKDEGSNHEMVDQSEKPGFKPAQEGRELEYSVFDDGLSSWTNIEIKQKSPNIPDGKPSSKPSSVKRKVPGSFGDEDEDEDMEGGNYAEKPQSRTERGPITDHMAHAEQSTSAQNATSRKKAKPTSGDSKEPKRRHGSPRRSFPGTLMDDDGDEQDHVAPLRNTKTKGRKTGAVKPVSRGSTTSNLADEIGEGVQTRRRSSRLTATGSGALVEDGDLSPRKSARTKKPTARASKGKKLDT